MQLELVRVECYRPSGFLNVYLDLDFALVCPWFARFKVEERDGVI